MGKLKVVWLCHFSNELVRHELPLSDFSLINSIKRILRKKEEKHADFAPWITNLINEFEHFEDVDLHIIAPVIGLQKKMSEFKLNNINYHFYRTRLPIIDYLINARIKFKYKRNRYYVKKFIQVINPDIVNLIGTENPYYSIATLDIINIPVYVSVQTVYTNPSRKKYGHSQLIWDIEIDIHKKEKYFGCSGRMHRDLIVQHNPKAIIFKMFFPIEYPQKIENISKEFDFVFFAARVEEKKGIEDAINALALVKRYKSDVTLNIIGKCQSDYKIQLLKMIEFLELNENIVFCDYFALHSDMHKQVIKSKYAILPIKLDIIPSSIIEAIWLDLPVVTYKTTGTPFLNSSKESILIAEINDIEKLAELMVKLLSDSSLGSLLRKNAKDFIVREFNNSNSARRLIANYKAVINHYRSNQEIPTDQLFNIDEFKKY